MLKYFAILTSVTYLACYATGGGFGTIKPSPNEQDRKATSSGSTAETKAQPKAEEQKPAGK